MKIIWVCFKIPFNWTKSKTVDTFSLSTKPNKSKIRCWLLSLFNSLVTWLRLCSRHSVNLLLFSVLFTVFKHYSIIPTDHLILLVRRCRNRHSLTIQVPITSTDIHKWSLFPDWNVFQTPLFPPEISCLLRARNYRNDPKSSDRYAWANSADPD